MTTAFESATVTAERAKYERVWAHPAYRAANHGLHLWQTRRDLFPSEIASAIDVGCGSGRLMVAWLDEGIDAYGIDIASNCLDAEIVGRLAGRVEVRPLWDLECAPTGRHDVAACCDVMEHIPPAFVLDSLAAVSECSSHVVFKIAHEPNRLFPDEPLHLTLEPPEWWLRQMMEVAPRGVVEFVGPMARYATGAVDSLFVWRPLG